MAAFFQELWNNITGFFSWFVSSFRFSDVLDILLVAFAIYSIIKLVRDSRAEQLIKGILVLALAYAVAYLLRLTTTLYVLQMLINNGLLVVVIIFQPEIRRALEQAGHSRIGGALSVFGMSNEEEQENIKRWQQTISAVIAAVETLQKQKMGALIVFERTTKLGEIVRSGTVINAQPTAELIGNIFFNKAPLHDGAMIIRDGMVHAAGCILPLTENLAISRELGTRHRAGVGISENSDAMVVILSAETGTVSMAVGGELNRNFSSEALRVALENGILWDRARQGKGDKEKKGPFRRWRSK